MPALLPGTPGTLVQRAGSGRAYWYRVYQSAAGKQVEDLVCKADDDATLADTRAQIEFAQWTAAQVRNLRKLDFQVADKGVAGVLVEMHNQTLLSAGICIVGTLCYMAWLNELGARAVTARTQDIDLAVQPRLKLAAPLSFLQTMQATKMGFVPVPGLPHQTPSTSVKLTGQDGLRVDVLTHGAALGTSMPLPQLMWHAQTVPFYDYLLHQPREAAILAGGHCVPVLLPQPERFIWHKLYSSASRKSFPEKAAKDLQQAVTLAAVLVEQEDESLAPAYNEAPAALKAAIRRRRSTILHAASRHPDTQAALESCLA